VFEPSEEAKLNVLIYVKKKVATERFSPASTEGKVREKLHMARCSLQLFIK